jgi:hyperosmotically inducible protein
MKTTNFHFLTLPLSVLLLMASMSPLADQQKISSSTAQANKNSSHADKRSAAEFWADFKKDSKQTWKDSKAAFKDGWIESKLETALILNDHLRASNIEVQVDQDTAILEGEVYSDIEKELAQNIAEGVEGIDFVTNNLRVVDVPVKTADSVLPKGRSFAQYVTDASTTASIKTALLASENIKGLAIDVDTFNDKVTLSGKVRTQEEKALAEAIAAKYDNVKGVINNLDINP